MKNGSFPMIGSVLEWKERAVKAFWSFADTRIRKEWVLFALGGSVMLVYVIVLFFGTRPRK